MTSLDAERERWSPADFAVDPIARKNRGNELAQSAAASHGLQMSDVRLRDWTFGDLVQLLA